MVRHERGTPGDGTEPHDQEEVIEGADAEVRKRILDNLAADLEALRQTHAEGVVKRLVSRLRGRRSRCDDSPPAEGGGGTRRSHDREGRPDDLGKR